MKIMARRKLLYGVLFSAGDVFECGDVEYVRAWMASGAVSLMGAELPEHMKTQESGDMVASSETHSEAPEVEQPEYIDALETESAQYEMLSPSEVSDDSALKANAALAESKATRRRGK